MSQKIARIAFRIGFSAHLFIEILLICSPEDSFNFCKKKKIVSEMAGKKVGLKIK